MWSRAQDSKEHFDTEERKGFDEKKEIDQNIILRTKNKPSATTDAVEEISPSALIFGVLNARSL